MKKTGYAVQVCTQQEEKAAREELIQIYLDQGMQEERIKEHLEVNNYIVGLVNSALLMFAIQASSSTLLCTSTCYVALCRPRVGQFVTA